MIVTDILFFLWVIVIFLVVYFLTKHISLHKTSYDFQDSEKVDMPYITLDIQGRKFNMIADSAAAVSIIKRDAVSQLTTYEHNQRKVNLTAITNDGVNSEVISIPININGKEVKSDFVVYEGPDIADFNSKGVCIHGLLGVEFFRKTKGIVDFKKQAVIFP